VNQAFAVLAIAAGMDSAIIDLKTRSSGDLYAADVVLGKDRFCGRFTKAFRAV
jgi:5-methyltetrahydrofolate--homocysteine methyltransferase